MQKEITVYFIDTDGALGCQGFKVEFSPSNERMLERITNRIVLIPNYSAYQMQFLDNGWCNIITPIVEMQVPVSWIIVGKAGKQGLPSHLKETLPGVLQDIKGTPYTSLQITESSKDGKLPFETVPIFMDYVKTNAWNSGCSHCREAESIMKKFLDEQGFTIYGPALYTLSSRHEWTGFSVRVIMDGNIGSRDAVFYFKKSYFRIERTMQPFNMVEHVTNFVNQNYGALANGNIAGVHVADSYIKIQEENVI